MINSKPSTQWFMIQVCAETSFYHVMISWNSGLEKAVYANSLTAALVSNLQHISRQKGSGADCYKATRITREKSGCKIKHYLKCRICVIFHFFLYTFFSLIGQQKTKHLGPSQIISGTWERRRHYTVLFVKYKNINVMNWRDSWVTN